MESRPERAVVASSEDSEEMPGKPSVSKTGRGLPGMMPALVAAKSTASGNTKDNANPGFTDIPKHAHRAHENSLSLTSHFNARTMAFLFSLEVTQQHGSGGKKTEMSLRKISRAMSPCWSQKLTGQVARGLRRKDLGHDRPRQSRFGQGGLDGPE